MINPCYPLCDPDRRPFRLLSRSSPSFHPPPRSPRRPLRRPPAPSQPRPPPPRGPASPPHEAATGRPWRRAASRALRAATRRGGAATAGRKGSGSETRRRRRRKTRTRIATGSTSGAFPRANIHCGIISRLRERVGVSFSWLRLSALCCAPPHNLKNEWNGHCANRQCPDAYPRAYPPLPTAQPRQKTDAEKIEAAEAAMRSAKAAAMASHRGGPGLGRGGGGGLGQGRGIFAHRPLGADPFFVDAARDWNNVAFGSLYRADIARYRREGSAVPAYLAAIRRTGRWGGFGRALHEEFDGAPPRGAPPGDLAAGRYYGAVAVQRERSRALRRCVAFPLCTHHPLHPRVSALCARGHARTDIF